MNKRAAAGGEEFVIREEPQAAAAGAGLRYVNDTMPGIRRRRAGKTYAYAYADGRRVRDAAELARIAALAIPPAYTEVWICADPRGHLQATGRDARGRKQYRYHPRWREVRDETKFARLVAFAEALPRVRRKLERDLRLPGLPRRKVLATVVRLLEWTCIRVGNEQYARDNNSFGLTTLKDRHVDVAGARMRFEFKGKSGKAHTCDISDRRIARIVARCQAIPGQDLFQYLDDDGARQTIKSEDVNDYIRELSGADFSAKDFRTWTGTVLAAAALYALGPAADAKEAKSRYVQVVDQVALQLNNTRAVCRKYYIHPGLFDIYTDGSFHAHYEQALGQARKRGLDREEAAVLALLREQLATPARKSARKSG